MGKVNTFTIISKDPYMVPSPQLHILSINLLVLSAYNSFYLIELIISSIFVKVWKMILEICANNLKLESQTKLFKIFLKYVLLQLLNTLNLVWVD